MREFAWFCVLFSAATYLTQPTAMVGMCAPPY